MSATIPSDATSEDDEWEYEYDETETETFYVVLDLASATTTTSKRTVAFDQFKGNAPTATANQTQPDMQHNDQDNNPALDSLNSAGNNTAHLGYNDQSTQHKRDQDRIQILDLHGKNPILSYKGQLLSCHWASPIGTDMLFSPAPVEDVSGTRYNPLTNLGNNDLLATSFNRLVANPARLQRRQNNSLTKSQEPKHSAAAIGQEGQAGPAKSGPARIQIQLAAAATPAERRQANFLEQLSEAKRRRGEDSFVSSGSFGGRRGKTRRSDYHGEMYYDEELVQGREPIEGFLRPGSPSTGQFEIGTEHRTPWIPPDPNLTVTSTSTFASAPNNPSGNGPTIPIQSHHNQVSSPQPATDQDVIMSDTTDLPPVPDS